MKLSSITRCALAYWMIVTMLSAADMPPAPSAFLLDDTHLFTEEQQAKLKAALSDVSQKTGVKIYVAAFTFVREGLITDTVSTLTAQWLHGEPGIIMAYNRGNDQCAIGCSTEFWNRYPTTEVMTLISIAGSQLSLSTVLPNERLLQVTQDTSGSLLQMEQNRLLRAQVFSSQDKQFALGFGAILVTLSGLVWAVRNRMKRHQKVRDVSYLFPEEIEVAHRLGATFGGGVMAQASPNSPRP